MDRWINSLPLSGWSPSGIDAMELFFGLLVFAAIAAVILGIRYLLDARVDPVEQRMRRFSGSPVSSYPPTFSPDASAKLPRSAILEAALKPFAVIAKPTNAKELGRLQDRLGYAGYRQERAMPIFLASKVILAIAGAGIVLWFNHLRPQPLQHAAFFTLLTMTIGFYLPSLWLQQHIQKRQSMINRALPDTLDLLVTCVDSGLGLDASMNRVAEELALSAPLLSQEIMQAALEIRAGSGRGEAFRRLAARTGVEDIRNLSSIIVQTEVFGTSMAKALRIMADGMRIRRMQLAEERAAKVGVKMTIPLVLCILPALFAVIMGPAIVQIFRLLLPTFGGGK
jgi:tight adherence protein C